MSTDPLADQVVQVEATRSLLDELWSELEAVVELHQPDYPDEAWKSCRECCQMWPCPTRRAISVDGDAA